MKTHILTYKFTAGLYLMLALQSCTYNAEPDRPREWAQPLQVDGVPNLHKVSAGLYRSAQPTHEGMRNLEELGITTVINLRYFSNQDETLGTRIEAVRITTLTWAPAEENAQAFLEIVSSRSGGPVLVHCLHGADRTGAMCAIYRITLEGWQPDEAIREMRHGDFGAHRIWINLAPWVRKTTNPAPIDHTRPDITRVTRAAHLQGSWNGAPVPCPL